MVGKFEIKERSLKPVLSIRTRTTLEKLPRLIGESYMKIFEYLKEIGEAPVSEPFAAFYNTDMQNLDVELGFPVAGSLPGRGDIKAGEIPAGFFASYLYKGPYSGMEKTYNEIFKRIDENGYKSVGVYYEYYLNSPGEDVGEDDLLTRMEIPLVKKQEK